MQLDRCQRPQKELLFERISNTFSCTHRHSKIMQIPTSVPTEYSLLLLETKTNPNVWPVFTRDASNSIHFWSFRCKQWPICIDGSLLENINPVISNGFFHHFCTLSLSPAPVSHPLHEIWIVLWNGERNRFESNSESSRSNHSSPRILRDSFMVRRELDKRIFVTNSPV